MATSRNNYNPHSNTFDWQFSFAGNSKNALLFLLFIDGLYKL